ncbi:MAG: exodeoxyribonuclease III [Parcubacteria group bacterium]|nr:exodeoxyribonuclease III [Parcubacteria group bacterium]
MKLISWNVNGIRAVIRKDVFVPFVKNEDPDILCLQETKAQQGQAEIDLPEYEEIWNSAERKGYSGTAIFTKTKPISIIYDLPGVKEGALVDKFGDTLKEGRVITMEFEKYFLVTVYTPNSKNSLERLEYRHKKWDPAFLTHVKKLEKKKPVVMCGDLNVAHKEIDLARPKDNLKNAGFTPEEREGADKIVDAGFIDTFRHLHPDQIDAYSWWSHYAQSRERNVGWRIDYFFVSQAIAKNVKEAFIRPEVMGSDHAPVGITLTI